jgi:hypothetical protein
MGMVRVSAIAAFDERAGFWTIRGQFVMGGLCAHMDRVFGGYMRIYGCKQKDIWIFMRMPTRIYAYLWM